jgi:hypothetical protein
MKITHRVVLATILPFLLVLAIVVVLFQQRIVAEQESLLRDDAQVRSLLSERFRDEREALSTAGRIMSGSVETARAVESRDIDVLRQWAPLFLSTSVSKVIFVDADGSVLFRTNDPFRFGDSALDWTPVAPALAGEDRQGFYRIDGAVVLADVRPVLRYGEIPVGAVITAIALDEAFLRNLVQRTDVALRLTVDGETSRSEGLDREVRQEVTMPLRSSEGSLTGQATVTFYRSDEIEALSRLRTRLLVLVGAMLLVVASILAWTINRYLVPYTVLVSELLDVARGQDIPRGSHAALLRRLQSIPATKSRSSRRPSPTTWSTIDRNYGGARTTFHDGPAHRSVQSPVDGGDPRQRTQPCRAVR